MLRHVFVVLIALFGFTSAKAYTPESGTWWNPAEPGWGILLEIQDNFLFAAVYTYQPAGPATWYTATGFLSGNARFVGQLDAFSGGTCLGCVYRPNSEQLGAGGPITIDFDPDDPTKALLAWGGRTNIPIERFQFYLKRPEDEQELPGVRLQLTKMLGEWQSVLDFTDNASASFQYFGDIAVLDILDSDNQGDFVDGCRPDDSLVGSCSNQAATDHRAVVEYVASNGEHILVVNNDAATFASYFLRVGTNGFEGEVSVYLKGSQPSVFYPVRGFRSASRTFVQGEVGPSKAGGAQDRPRAGFALPAKLFAEGPGSAFPEHAKARQDVLERLHRRLESAASAKR